MSQGFTHNIPIPVPVSQGGTGTTTSTGTGSVVLNTSPTLITPTLTSPILTTPNLGTPSALILTNATGDQLGVTDGSSAAAGHVGEFISDERLFANSINMSSNTITVIAQISLTAGDWDLTGNVFFNGSNILQTTAWISTNNAILADSSRVTLLNVVAGVYGSGNFPTPSLRLNLTATTTVYLLAFTNALAGVLCSGGIFARRMR